MLPTFCLLDPRVACGVFPLPCKVGRVQLRCLSVPTLCTLSSSLAVNVLSVLSNLKSCTGLFPGWHLFAFNLGFMAQSPSESWNINSYSKMKTWLEEQKLTRFNVKTSSLSEILKDMTQKKNDWRQKMQDTERLMRKDIRKYLDKAK